MPDLRQMADEWQLPAAVPEKLPGETPGVAPAPGAPPATQEEDPWKLPESSTAGTPAPAPATPTGLPPLSPEQEDEHTRIMRLAQKKMNESVEVERSLGGEIGASVVRGAIGVAKLPLQIANIVGGDVLGSKTVKRVAESGIYGLENLAESPTWKPSQEAGGVPIDLDRIIQSPGQVVNQIGAQIKNPRFWAAQLPEGAMSMVPFFVGSWAPKAIAYAGTMGKALEAANAAGDIAKATAIAQKIERLGTIGGYGMAMAMEAGQGEENVRHFELKNPDKPIPWANKVLAIAATGVVAGGLEAFSLSRVFMGKYGGELTGEAMIKALMDGKAGNLLARKVIDSVVTEGLTEGAQSIVENAAARLGFDPDQKFTEGVVESILVGAALGGLGGGWEGARARQRAAGELADTRHRNLLNSIQIIGDRIHQANLDSQAEYKATMGATEEAQARGEVYGQMQGPQEVPQAAPTPPLGPAAPGTPVLYGENGQPIRPTAEDFESEQALVQAQAVPPWKRTALEKLIVDRHARELEDWGQTITENARAGWDSTLPNPFGPPPATPGGPVITPAFPGREPMAINAADIAEVAAPTGEQSLVNRLRRGVNNVNETGEPAALQDLTELARNNQETVKNILGMPEREGLRPIAERLDDLFSRVDEGDPLAAKELHELLSARLDKVQDLTRGEILQVLPDKPITPAGAYFEGIEDETKPPEAPPTPEGEAPPSGVPPTPPETPPGVSGAPTPESGTPTATPPPSAAPVSGQGPSAAGVPPMTPKVQDLVNQIQAYEGGRYSPEFVKMQQELGLEVIPGVRLQDADDAGLMFTLLQQGKITPEEWGTFVEDLRASNKIREAPAVPTPPAETQAPPVVEETPVAPEPQAQAPTDENINAYKEAVKGLVDDLEIGDEEKARFKQAIDEQTTVKGVDQAYLAGPPEIPPPPKAPGGREIRVRGPRYDLAKAVERGDRATIIKAYGGFNSRARVIKTFEPEERRLLFPFMRRGAQGPDSLLQELQNNYPHLFGTIESDDQFLAMIISGEMYKNTDIDDWLKLEEEYYNDIREQAGEEGVDEAGLAEIERDVEGEVNAEENDLAGETGPAEEASQGAGNIPGLTPPKPKAPSVIDQKVAETLKVTPDLDEGKIRRVFRALPDASPTEAAMLAQDDELFNQVAKGNFSATEREQLYKNHKEAQGNLPGIGGGGLFDQPEAEVKPKPAPKVPGVTPSSPKTPEQKATALIMTIKDPERRKWAQAYFDWVKGGREGTSPPLPNFLSRQWAEGLRGNIDGLFPPAQAKPVSEAPKFEIGDMVRPKPGSDMPGFKNKDSAKVTHIQVDADGKQKLRIDGGGPHWNASEFEKVEETKELDKGEAPKEFTQEDYRKKALEIFEGMNESQRTGVQHGLFPHDLMEAAKKEGYTEGQKLSVALMWAAEKKAAESVVAKSATTEEETVTEQEATASKKLAEQVLKWLKAPTVMASPIVGLRPFTSAQLFKWADEAFGGTQAEGKYTPKDAYDAMELGVNKFIQANPTLFDPHANDPAKVVQRLEKLTSILPTQTRRTGESEEFQQFSTPPALAYLVSWVGNVGPHEVVLEPSAGTGSLAVFASNAGAPEIIVNELSPRRAELVKQLGFDRVFTENAEQLNNILPKDVKPTLVVMNPPFSATAGRLQGKRVIQTAAVHIEQALKRLEEGGRLVAIVGRGMAFGKPAFTEWWGEIRKEYKILANVSVSGKNYTKYGTAFDNQIVVIDKSGPTTSPPVVGTVEKLTDLVPLLEGAKNERIPATEQQPGQPGREEGTPPTQAEAGTGRPVSPPTHGLEPGKEEGGAPGAVGGGGGAEVNVPEHPGQQEAGSGNAGVRGTPVRPGGTVGTGLPGAGEGAPVGGETGAGGVGTTGRLDGRERSLGEQQDSGRHGPVTVEAKGEEEEENKGKFTDSVFEDYKPKRVKIAGAKPHPAQLKESAAMASVSPPAPTYTPNIPQKTIKEGKLSEAQLETIVYAGQAHSQMLPSGERRGFAIGDGTGLGKGREISGIFQDNWNQGRKKGVWISQNPSLLKDAKRDMKGIDWNPELVKNLPKASEQIKDKEGIMFLGYDTLRSGQSIRAREGGRQSRIDQLVKWLGEDFDGVIAFDEAHNMNNAKDESGQGGFGQQRRQASQKALAGVELQRRLPNARVVYVSATMAEEPDHLAFADRLGLWGPGTAFANRNRFLSEISSGGVASMEVVARDLKALGKYVARNLSYDDVKYERLTHELTPEQTKIYNELAQAWQIIFANINKALDDTGAGSSPTQKRQALAMFWGYNQRFFNQIVTSMQMPTVLKSMENDLAKGYSPIVQLVNTYGEATDREIDRKEEGAEYDELDLSPRQSLIQYLERSFPTQQYEEYTDENGDTKMRPVVDSNGNPVENAEAVAAKNRLIARLGMLRFPDNPLDQIINKFGPKVVAEVTGRKQRIYNNKLEKRGNAAVAKDIEAYKNDEKTILVFSGKGDTGASYHADLGIKNQRLRRHYCVQPGWQAKKAMQGFGRSHRTNQKQAPEFILTETNIKGQKRFISAIARRLDQLGALTKGQRQTTSTGLLKAEDNLLTPYAKRAIDRFIDDLRGGRVAGLTSQEYEDQTGWKLTYQSGGSVTVNYPDAKQFFNRLLAMEIEKQNNAFDHFDKLHKEILRQEAEQGTLDVGIETIQPGASPGWSNPGGRIKKVSEQSIYTEPDSKAETKVVAFDLINPTRPRQWNQVNFRGTWFYTNNRSGALWAVDSSPRNVNAEMKYLAVGPGEFSRRWITQNDLVDQQKWTRVRDAMAKPQWDQAVAALPKETTHRIHLITGTLLPIWDRLNGPTMVFRLQDDTGKRYLGRMIFDEDLDDTLRSLGATNQAQSSQQVKSAGDVYERVLDNNWVVTLANGWQFKRGLVSGEQRIELVGVDPDYLTELENLGVIRETHGYQTRLFIPIMKGTDTRSIDIIHEIIKTKPVIEAAPRYAATNRQSIKQGILGTGPIVTTEGIKSRLGDSVKVEEFDDGSGWGLTLPNGKYIAILKNQKIPKPNFEDLKKTYKDITEEGWERGTVGGEWRPMTVGGVVALAKGVGMKLVDHELFHAAADLVLTQKEMDQILRKYGDWEAAAEAYQEWSPTETAVEPDAKTIFQKIQRFFHRIMQILKADPTEAIFKSIRSGQIWMRTEVGPGTVADAYSFKEVTWRKEKDGFGKPDQPIDYYLKKLEKLGCSDHLLSLAKELTQSKKRQNYDISSEDGIQHQVLRWDGHSLYYLDQWEKGSFNRLQIDPTNGYVDWGNGQGPSAPSTRYSFRTASPAEQRLSMYEERMMAQEQEKKPLLHRFRNALSTENREAATQTFRFLYDEVVDRMAPFERAETRALKAGGIIPKGESANYTVGFWRGQEGWVAQAVMKAGVYHEITEQGRFVGDAKKVGESLTARLEPLRELAKKRGETPDKVINDLFNRFMVAQRDLELAGETGVRESGEIKGTRPDESRQALADLKELYGEDYATLEKVAGRLEEDGNFTKGSVREWTDQAILQRLLQAGFLDRPRYEEIKHKNQYYVPFKRLMDELDDYVDAYSQALGVKGRVVQKIKGSEKAILNPLEMLMQLAAKANYAYARNRMLDGAAKLAEWGDPEIKEVPAKFIPVDETLKQEVDVGLRGRLMALADRLGIPVKVVKSLRGRRLGEFKSWLRQEVRDGNITMEEAKEITTRFATTERVLSHELGHALDKNYDLVNLLITQGTPAMKRELRAIADQRADLNSSKSYKRYVRKREEQVAEFVSRYIADRAVAKALAPEAVKTFERFLQQKGLTDLKDFKWSHQMGSMEFQNRVWARSPLPPEPGTVPYYRNGFQRWLKLPPDMFKATQNMMPEDMGIFLRIAKAPADLLRAGAVTTPEFGIVTNPVRDIIQAWVFSRFGFNPLKWFRDLGLLLSKDKNTVEMRNKAEAMGGFMATLAQSFIEPEKITADDITGKRKGIIYQAHPVQALRHISAYLENMTRFSIYKQAIEKGLTPAEAIHEMRRTTLDFRRFGGHPVVRYLNMIIPFFNAGIQGTDKLLSELAGPNKWAVMRRLALLAAGSVGLWMLAHNDDRYKELENWERNYFWHIPAGDQMLRIPKPFEAGILFGSVPERILDALVDKNVGGMQSALGASWKAMTPDFIPAFARPIVEGYANYNWFLDRPIEDVSIQKLPVELRSKPWTTELAKAVSRIVAPVVNPVFELSPIKVEQIIRTTTGGLGSNYFLPGIDVLLRKAGVLEDVPQPARNAIELWGVRALFTKPPTGYRAKTVNDFMENYQKILQADQGWKLLWNSGQMDQLDAFLEKHPEAMFARVARQVMTEMGNVRKQRSAIYESKTLDPDQKRTRLDALDEKIVHLAKMGQAFMDHEIADNLKMPSRFKSEFGIRKSMDLDGYYKMVVESVGDAYTEVKKGLPRFASMDPEQRQNSLTRILRQARKEYIPTLKKPEDVLQPYRFKSLFDTPTRQEKARYQALFGAGKVNAGLATGFRIREEEAR
jgi:predicted RNA methylase